MPTILDSLNDLVSGRRNRYCGWCMRRCPTEVGAPLPVDWGVAPPPLSVLRVEAPLPTPETATNVVCPECLRSGAFR